MQQINPNNIRADEQRLRERIRILQLALELAEAELIRARFNDPDPRLQENT